MLIFFNIFFYGDIMYGMITAESLDESLHDSRLREIKELKREIKTLKEKRENQDDAYRKLEKKYDNLQQKTLELTAKNLELSKKITIYEHDPIICVATDDGYDIEYWDTETKDYETFMCIFNNPLESDLPSFCEDLVFTLKDMYLVE